MKNHSTRIGKIPAFENDVELEKFLTNSFTDSLKQAIRLTVKIMIKDEMECLRQSVEEKLSFNGFYERNLLSTAGKINDVQVPRFREKNTTDLNLRSLNVFENEQDKFFKLVAEMHRLGVSNRKVKQLCQTVFGVKISANRVSLVHKELAEEEALQINSRRLEGMEFQYLLLDGLWVKCKRFGLAERNNTVLLCALGITKEGKREIIGFMTSDAEDAESWGQMIGNLKERGLNKDKLELVIADDNGGLVSAVGHYLPGVKLQACVVHKMRNVIGQTKHKNKKQIANDVKIIYQSRNREEATERMKQFARKWYVAEEKSVNSLRFNFERTLTYFDWPPDTWKKIRTTNILEREFREVRRRIKVFDNSFNNQNSIIRYGNSIFDNLNNHYPAKSYTH